jgi:hypothetical protein
VYCLLTYFPNLDLKTLLGAYFWLLATVAVSGNLKLPLNRWAGSLTGGLPAWRLGLPAWLGAVDVNTGATVTEVDVSPFDAVALGIGLCLATADFQSGHANFTLNNLIATLIAVDVLQLVGLNSYRTAVALSGAPTVPNGVRAGCTPWGPISSRRSIRTVLHTHSQAHHGIMMHAVAHACDLETWTSPHTDEARASRAAGLLLYDVFWVFGSSSVVGENVMMTVATSDAFTGPFRLIFPRWEALVQPGATGDFPFSLLGLGDVAVPGLLICLMLKVRLHVCDFTELASIRHTASDRGQRVFLTLASQSPSLLTLLSHGVGAARRVHVRGRAAKDGGGRGVHQRLRRGHRGAV